MYLRVRTIRHCAGHRLRLALQLPHSQCWGMNVISVTVPERNLRRSGLRLHCTGSGVVYCSRAHFIVGGHLLTEISQNGPVFQKIRHRQKLAEPNTQFHAYYPKGLAKEKRYHFTNRALTYSILEFGDLVNTVAPVHIRPDSVTHHLLAKFVKMDGETEDFCAYGDALMYGGVHLHPAFGGTGYDENVRYFPDFASRLYLMDCNL